MTVSATELDQAVAQAAMPNQTQGMDLYAWHCRRELRHAIALARLASAAADDAAAAAQAAQSAASQAMARSLYADQGIQYAHLSATSPCPPLEEGGEGQGGGGGRSPAQESCRPL